MHCSAVSRCWEADCQYGERRHLGANERSVVASRIHSDVADEQVAPGVMSAVSADVDDAGD